MGRVYTEEDEYVKEMSKHEQFHSKWTLGDLKPGNPYVYRPFPRMMYQAQQAPNGKWAMSLPQPSRFGFHDDAAWGHACRAADAFVDGCRRIVDTADEHAKALADGWRDTAAEALAWRDGLDHDIATAAAERNYADRNMGHKALAESAAEEAETFGHVPEIKRKKVKRKAAASA